VIEGMTGLTIKIGGSFVTLNAGGVFISGTIVSINSGGAALSGTSGSAVSPAAALVAAIAADALPGWDVKGQEKGFIKTGDEDEQKKKRYKKPGDGDKQKKSWIEIKLVDEEKNPVPGEAYKVILPDGETVATGSLDEKGFARIEGIDPGTCKITFPNLDKDAWEKT